MRDQQVCCCLTIENDRGSLDFRWPSGKHGETGRYLVKKKKTHLFTEGGRGEVKNGKNDAKYYFRRKIGRLDSPSAFLGRDGTPLCFF